MKLRTLIKDLKVTVKGSKEVDVTGISSDSRRVSPGNLFIAKKGGVPFIPQAVNAGAVAIVTDLYDPFFTLPQIICENPSLLEAHLAARYYGEPAKELFVVGVTGTKGKTTTTYLIKHLLDGMHIPSGLIGTVETVIGDHRFASSLTTHDVISNQKWLREMIQKKCAAAVLEVSSHGLEQGRVDEIGFDLAVFTNLYPDHLDYHKTLEAYIQAKAKLFHKADQAILNADSFWGENGYAGFTFGIEKGDLRAKDISFSANGTEFVVQNCKFYSPLIGKFNIYNALGAIAVGLQKGASLPEMRDILAEFPSVPARLERIGNVFIDFAHTGEALENVLQTLKAICQGKLIVVFGCGGDRDPQRRVNMAQVADRLADLSIITTDNPRTEDPQEIANQIRAGFQKDPVVELDRKKAIQKAIALATEKDLVLIAGKGHEKVQIFAHQTILFDDVAVVKEILFGA